MIMVYECTDRRNVVHMHRLPSDLSSKEAMIRLGVYERQFRVVCWPEGEPHRAHTVQPFEVHENTDKLRPTDC